MTRMHDKTGLRNCSTTYYGRGITVSQLFGRRLQEKLRQHWCATTVSIVLRRYKLTYKRMECFYSEGRYWSKTQRQGTIELIACFLLVLTIADEMVQKLQNQWPLHGVYRFWRWFPAQISQQRHQSQHTPGPVIPGYPDLQCYILLRVVHNFA